MIGLLLMLAAGAQAVATPAPMLQPGETLLEISHTGEVRGVPDRAGFDAELRAEGESPAEALSAIGPAVDRITRALTGAGVGPQQIRTEGLNVAPRYKQDRDGDDTEQVIGYRARMSVRVRDVPVADAAKVADLLVNAGLSELSGPSFTFSNDAPLQSRARNAAIAAAMQEARDYAAAFHMNIGRVIRVSERRLDRDGTGEVIVTGSRRRFSPTLQPGEQTVSATVWMDVALVAR